MTFSVCIDAVFSGQDFYQSLILAKAAGYGAYEFWSWWDKDMRAVYAAQEKTGLSPAAFCTKLISLTAPEARGEYIAGLRESIAAAQKLGCKNLISQCGQDTGEDREIQADSIVQGLREAAPILEDAGITLLLEPLNLLDHPGYFLTSSAEAFSLIERAGSPRIRMLFDIYHQQISEGDILRSVEKFLPRIGHFHAAGNPGRHEPFTGELNYGYIFAALRGMGYAGYVGLEYFPLELPESGLRRILEL